MWEIRWLYRLAVNLDFDIAGLLQFLFCGFKETIETSGAHVKMSFDDIAVLSLLLAIDWYFHFNIS